MAISLTAWLDPILDYFARTAGIPTADYSAQVGGEGLGVGFEILAETFAKGWMAKAIEALTGAIASGYAVFGKDVPIRLRRELLALGTHMLLRLARLTPQDIEEIKRSLADAIMALERGDVEAFLRASFRTPEELKAIAESLGLVSASSTPVTMPPPTPVPASAPASAAETTPVAPETAAAAETKPVATEEEKIVGGSLL